MDIDLRELLVGHLHSGRIGFCVDLGMDQEPGSCGGGGNEVDYNLMTDQGLAAPVLADEGEQAMFDLVPFAGARGRWQTLMFSPVSSASFCNSSFQSLTRDPLRPPESAVISNSAAWG